MDPLKYRILYVCFGKKRSYYDMALSVRPYVRKQSSRYLHDNLYKCILGQDNVSNTNMIVPPFIIPELCPFEYCKQKRVRTITQ